MTATIARDVVFKENDKWFFYAEEGAVVECENHRLGGVNI